MSTSASTQPRSPTADSRPLVLADDPSGLPGPPRRLHVSRGLGALGRLLMVAGMVVLLFVAYQLWGTGLREAANQRSLRSEFQQQLSESKPAAPPEGSSRRAAGDGGVATGRTPDGGRASADPQVSGSPAPVAPPPAPGDPVAVLRIPKLELDKVVVEGTDVASLRKGPGHQPGTAPIGGPGNAVIGGHRTTYGAPFYRLDELEPGDEITVQVPAGEARYMVTGSKVVDPTDVWILDPTSEDRLTLFTCTPRFSAAQRLVVTAALQNPVVVDRREPGVRTADTAATTPDVTAGVATPAPAVQQRRAGAPPELAAATGSVATAAAWGIGTALLAGAVWLLGRRYRRLLAYPLGAPAVAIALFLTFEHVAALLPSAV